MGNKKLGFSMKKFYASPLGLRSENVVSYTVLFSMKNMGFWTAPTLLTGVAA